MSTDVFEKRNKVSKELHKQACALLPGGVTRDVVHVEPFPLYISSGNGSKVWDVDGHMYVDLIMGNGALILGHNHNEVSDSIQKQIPRGLHLGSCTPLEIDWAQLVCEMVPSADLVRFTTTGSEATQLALRLARAHSGRNRYIRFSGNFHGWHDGVAIGSNLNSTSPDSAGIPLNITSLSIVCTPNSIEEVQAVPPEEVAAIILEPSGGKIGLLQYTKPYLTFLREYCSRHDIVLIFDEVVSGFRWAPGGAQSTLEIYPDLTTLGKILGGGVSCGAVCGKKEIMSLLSIIDTGANDRVHHGGTFSGNPLAAVSGIATLEQIKDGRLIEELNSYTSKLVERLSNLWEALEVPGGVFGHASVFHYVFDCLNANGVLNKPKSIKPYEMFQRLMSENGVLIRKFTGILSSAHTAEDADVIVRATELTLRAMKQQGYFS
jgi:glutamate-1-semialdehyde 2,1-aminomutase